MKFSELSIGKLKQILASKKKLVIVTHRNPDGDALGSSLGFKFFLEKKNHEVDFISPTPFTQNLNWIQGTKDILLYENDLGKKLCEAKIKSADYIFCLDFNALTRLENLGDVIKNASAEKIMIDHHQQPEDFAAIAFSDVKYCSTAEMIYDIIVDLQEENLVDEKIAECLYVGLVTDNGFFQFNNTTPNALQVGGALVAHGVKPEYVSEKVNNVFRETRLRFFGYCLQEKLKLVKNESPHWACGG